MILSNQGRSLYVRQTIAEDAGILSQAYQDPAFLRLYRSNEVQPSEEELYDLLTERAQHSPKELGYVEFMIIHKQQGPIGVMALGDYSPLHQRAEFLIGLFEQKHRSIGYGTEATLLMLDLAFNGYQLHKIYAYVYEYNQFAQRNMIKFGFKPEGLLIEHHYLRQEQRFVNLHLNGLTETQFRSCDKIRRYSLRLVGRDVTQSSPMLTITLDNPLAEDLGQQFIKDWLR